MKNRLTLMLAGLLAAAMMLGGCRMVEPAPTPSPAEQVEQAEERIDLIGTTWEVESFGESENPLPTLPDAKLTLNMLVDRYAGYNGCDWFLGVYDIEGDTLRYNTPATTATACEDIALSTQAATYMSALVNITQYELEDDKLLTYTVGDQQMATFIPADPVPLEGTAWTAKFVNAEDRMLMASSYDLTVSARFENGTLTGFGGCNDYEADYVIDGNQITISNIQSAEEECSEPAGASEIEAAYFAALEATTNYTELVASLIFTGADGQDLVLFGTP